MRRGCRAAALLAAAVLLSGCAISLDGISLGGRKTVRGKGEDRLLIDCLSSTATGDDHTLVIADVHFADGGVELIIDPAREDTITFEAPQNVLDSLDVSIDHERGIITVTGNDRVQFADVDLSVTVGVPLKSLTVEGGVEIDASLPDVRSFQLDVDGAVEGEFRFGELALFTAQIDGAGELELSGTCARAEITLRGAGEIDADRLLCTDAAVNIEGAGSCGIYVTGTLDASVEGVGAVRYSGNPVTVNQSGGGLVAVKEK